MLLRFDTADSGSKSKEHEEFEKKVRQLQDMGVDQSNARAALSMANWDLAKAIEQIFK
jgi:hypothetical protein